MPSTLNSNWVSINISILDCVKLENDEQIGAYVKCICYLAKCDDAHKGWAYMNGQVVSDPQSARALHYTTPNDWVKMKTTLIKNNALEVDKSGAWGIKGGTENWWRHQKEMKRRIQQRDRMQRYREGKRHQTDEIPERNTVGNG